MTQDILKSQKPLDRMQAAFPDLYDRGNGWWAHNDNPRFDCREDAEGNIRIKSWTNKTGDDILSLGCIPLTRGHLYAKPGQWSTVQSRAKLDLLDLAEHTCIHWQFYFNEGYSDEYTYAYSNGNTVKCIKLGGYFTPDGQEQTKHQVRLSLNKEPRFLWNQNTPGEPGACGYHHLDWARAAGYLFICEGNSDWATFTFHRLPSLGLPGADLAKKLDVDLVKDIPRIYIIEEPDQVKKLKRSGQGFYRNVRQHLREQGYEGEIFSIRFMEIAGYKDPSDLHKAIYASCKEKDESPFYYEVHQRFLEAIDQAIQQAIPEGNESLFPKSVARDWSKITFEEFSRLVWKVTSEYLSPRQKMIICYLFLYMKEVKPGEFGWQIDAKTMAPDVGLQGTKGAQTFLTELSYLQKSVGILRKNPRARKEYVNGEDQPEQVRYKGTDLYIEPSPHFYTPTSYCVVTQDQHKPGGPRIAFAKCVNCGSENLDRTEWQHCRDCNYDHFKPIYDTPPHSHENDVPPDEQVIESTLSEQEVDVKINQTAINQPVEPVEGIQESHLKRTTNEEKQETIPEIPKMGFSDIDSITDTQNGVLGKTLFSLDAPPPVPPSSFPQNGLPTRMTYCCNVPFQHGPDGPECSHPLCPGKQKVRVTS